MLLAYKRGEPRVCAMVKAPTPEEEDRRQAWSSKTNLTKYRRSGTSLLPASRMSVGSLFPVNILLPVLGILTVTSEWSQRTAQTTFTLVPVRGRVLVAKLAAGVVMAVASVAASMVIAAAANVVAIATGSDGGWGVDAVALGNAVVAQLIGVIWGLGLRHDAARTRRWRSSRTSCCR